MHYGLRNNKHKDDDETPLVIDHNWKNKLIKEIFGPI